MRDSSVGLQAGVDARRWARVLRRAHDVALHGGRVPSIVRGVIADSWERCAETGVDPGDPGAPLVVEPDDAAARWREHPLSRTTDILSGVLGNLLYDARHIVVVSDAGGCLLWSDGHPDVLSASEAIRFTPGHAWSERAAGTNAIGTALAAGHPVQVFSAEHYRAEIHGWQCSGAPIRDPETGAVLGAVDVTGRYDTASPHTLALVQMAAGLVEERLRAQMFERDAEILGLFAERAGGDARPEAALSPSGRVLAATGGWGSLERGSRIELPDPGGDELTLADGTGASIEPLGDGRLMRARGRRGRQDGTPSGDVGWARREGHGGRGDRGGPLAGRARPTVPRLELRGHPRARFFSATGEHRLTVRHSQITELLARHPDGLDARSLSALLYGEIGHEVAVRGELHRLREILGPALATRPYRLVGVPTDVTAAPDEP